MPKPYRITIEVDADFYDRWRKYLLDKYGITPAGRYSKIREFNTDFFRKIMEEEMNRWLDGKM